MNDSDFEAMFWMRPPKLHAASLRGESEWSGSGGGDSGSSEKTDLKKFIAAAARLGSVWRKEKEERVYELLWILLRMVKW